MATLFPDVPFIGPLPILAIPAVVVFLALLLSLLILRWYGRRLEAFLDTPDYQIQQLAKKTVDYGVAYAEIQFGKLLGKGSQGEVFLANWRGLAVAVKKVDTRTVPPEIVDEFCQEADIMRRLRHPCLTLFMGVSLEHPYLSIVTELVSRGALFDILHEDSTGFTWKRALQIMTDIASGMTYLHAHSPPIIHRSVEDLRRYRSLKPLLRAGDCQPTRHGSSSVVCAFGLVGCVFQRSQVSQHSRCIELEGQGSTHTQLIMRVRSHVSVID
jgi:hypothetical protein